MKGAGPELVIFLFVCKDCALNKIQPDQNKEHKFCVCKIKCDLPSPYFLGTELSDLGGQQEYVGEEREDQPHPTLSQEMAARSKIFCVFLCLCLYSLPCHCPCLWFWTSIFKLPCPLKQNVFIHAASPSGG